MEKSVDELTIERVRELIGVSDDTPMLKITTLNPNNMNILTKYFKDTDADSLKFLRDHYALTTISGHNEFQYVVIYDILMKDIENPEDIKYYIPRKRILQTLKKFFPKIASTFLYEDKDEDFLERKIVNAIELAFKFFRNSYNKETDKILVSMRYDQIGSNTHMQEMINKSISNNFNVINTIIDNELINKYILISEKEKENNDNNAN